MTIKVLKPDGANSYPNLEACCEGNISIEGIKRFRVAMHEYDRFMDSMEALLAPRKEQA
jgi:hypothetical protein